jgi:hypothetical protein
MAEMYKIKYELTEIMEEYSQASKKFKEKTRELYNNVRHQIKIRTVTTQECNCYGCRAGKQICGYTINFVATLQENPVPTSVQSTYAGVMFNWVAYSDWPYPLGYGSTELGALKHLLEILEKPVIENNTTINAPLECNLH